VRRTAPLSAAVAEVDTHRHLAAEGVSYGLRADPASRTSAPGPTATEVRSRRGAEPQAMIETRRASRIRRSAALVGLELLEWRSRPGTKVTSW
jgi:hypothetical protein